MKPLLRKSNNKTNFLSVDPGWNTGLAYWQGDNKLPWVDIITEPGKNKKLKLEEDRIEWMFQKFEAKIKALPPVYDKCFIEGSELWTSSPVSMAAAARGDTFGLAYIIGGYMFTCMKYRLGVEIINPKKWKAQLNRLKLTYRLNTLLGVEYKEHIREAVGLGLWVKGVL